MLSERPYPNQRWTQKLFLHVSHMSARITRGKGCSGVTTGTILGRLLGRGFGTKSGYGSSMVATNKMAR